MSWKDYIKPAIYGAILYFLFIWIGGFIALQINTNIGQFIIAILGFPVRLIVDASSCSDFGCIGIAIIAIPIVGALAGIAYKKWWHK